MRILIAEDDPKLLKSLVHIFEMNNYMIDGVDNGKEAFDFASSGEYDGLVLDIMMPEMDGIGLSLAKAIAETHKGEITAYKKDACHIGFKVVL